MRRVLASSSGIRLDLVQAIDRWKSVTAQRSALSLLAEVA